MAQLINILISIKEINLKKTKINRKIKTKKNKLYKLFLLFIKKEKIWAYFQCAKVLNYFDYNTFNEFYNINYFINKTDKYDQKSNVFSYIILRSIIYNDLTTFLNLLYKYNKDNVLKDSIPDDIKIKFLLNN